MITIDSYSYGSALRSVHPWIKIFYGVTALFFCVMTRCVLASLFLFFGNMAISIWKGKIPFSFYIKQFLFPLIFSLLTTITIVINWSPSPLSAFAFPLGNGYLTVGSQGLIFASQLIITVLSSLSCFYIIVLHTPIHEFLWAIKELQIPDLFIELMLLTYRFIFLLFSISASITISQHARLGNKNLTTSYRSFASMLAATFIHSLKQANQVYDALESRGYDGKIPILLKDCAFHKKDTWIFAVFLLCSISIYFFSKGGLSWK